jgi:hypothetical protein
MTDDYSRYRRLARAFGGDGSGRPNPLKLVGGTALPANAEHPAALADIDADDEHPAAPPDDDIAPSRVSMVRESPPAPATVTINPVDTLLTALDAAADDLERGYLLAAAPVDVRESLSGALAYRAMMAPPANAALLDTLMAALDSAVDDVQRGALLGAASRELRTALADRLWWRRVSVGDTQQRYLDQIQ